MHADIHTHAETLIYCMHTCTHIRTHTHAYRGIASKGPVTLPARLPLQLLEGEEDRRKVGRGATVGVHACALMCLPTCASVSLRSPVASPVCLSLSLCLFFFLFLFLFLLFSLSHSLTHSLSLSLSLSLSPCRWRASVCM